MANGSIKKRGKSWRARYYDPDGNEVVRHFPRKTDGEEWLNDQLAAMRNNEYVDPNAGRILVKQYTQEWEDNQVGSENTLRINDIALRKHIVPELGDKQLNAVRRSHVQRFVKQLSQSIAPNSVRSVYQVLQRVFASAVDDHLLARTPCHKISLPPLPDEEIVPPTIEQVTALAEKIDDRFRAPLILLAGSGIRIGELLGLKVGDIDFLRRSVRVRRQRLQSGEIRPPKSKKSNRTIPLDKSVIDTLAAHVKNYPSDEGWVVTKEDGTPTWYRHWKNVWHSVTKAAKSPDSLTTHDLRHFYASSLISGGASVKQVQTVLGHASPTTTLRVYAHLWPGDEDKIRDIVTATLHSVVRTVSGLDDLESGSDAGQAA